MKDFERCIKFLNNNCIKLKEYQKDMLKAFMDGKEVRCARGIGRTFVAECYGEYIKHILSNNDYSKEPDIVFTYKVSVDEGVVNDCMIERARNILSEEQFKKEYLCE